MVCAIFAVGQLTEANILTPKLLGDRMHLHPVWVIFALFAGGTLFGFIGVAARRAGGGGDRRAGALRAGALSPEHALQRRAARDRARRQRHAPAVTQLAIDLPFRPALGAADFLVSECNRAAFAWIERWPDWPGRALVLYGPAQCGKSHLADSGRRAAAAGWSRGPALRALHPPELAAVPRCRGGRRRGGAGAGAAASPQLLPRNRRQPAGRRARAAFPLADRVARSRLAAAGHAGRRHRSARRRSAGRSAGQAFRRPAGPRRACRDRLSRCRAWSARSPRRRRLSTRSIAPRSAPAARSALALARRVLAETRPISPAAAQRFRA